LVDCRIVVFDKDAFSAVVKQIEQFADYKVEEETYNVATLQFVADNQENLALVKSFVESTFGQFTIKCPAGFSLAIFDRKEIEEMSNEKDGVSVLWREDKDGSYMIEIEGLTEAAKRVYEKVNGIVSEYSAAVELSNTVVWYYVSNKNGLKYPYPLRASRHIEHACKNGSSSVQDLLAVGGRHTVDLVKMTFNEMNGSDQGKVERKQAKDNALPAHWSAMAGDYKCVQLDTTSAEYQTVEKKFQETSSMYHKFNVVKIERIQKATLYRQFALKEAQIAQRLKHSIMSVKKELFHGTSKDAYQSIISGDFNRSYAGVNGTAYGQGVYFATTSQYSHNYASPDPYTNQRRMFLATVLTGQYCKGHPQMKEPDKILSNISDQRYDSAVDSLTSPTIYVVFRDSLAYPSYLITYTSRY